ncbi:MAG: flagellar hook-basal body complex protein FliE [Pseudomonadota bacterium]
MTVPTSAAASAYQATAQLADQLGQGTKPPTGTIAEAGDSFQSLLADAVTSVAESGRNVEAQTMAASVGQADMIDVVTAVAETEVALQSMVSLRDRVIASYEEIMRMPI